jgi:hypothetical protein
MRFVSSLTMILAAGLGAATALPSPKVQAAPLPVPAAASWKEGTIVRNADYWRRYYRRHADTWQRYWRPEPQPDAPVRPLSCGEFRFWDGERCVDVRFR